MLYQSKCLIFKKEFLIALFVLLTFSLTSFLRNCFYQYGADISYVLSADKLFIGTSYGNDMEIFLIYLLPFFIVMPFADSYINDKQEYVLPAIISRIGGKKYYYTKLFWVFMSAFFVVCIPFLINYLLCLIAFPLKSENYSYYALSANQSPYYSFYLSKTLFQVLFVKNPYIYNLFYLVCLSLFCSLSAVICYQFSYFWNKSKVFFICIPFLINNFLILFSYILPINISPFDYFFAFNINDNKYYAVFFLYLIVPIIVIAILSPRCINKLRFIEGYR